jgi:two-component system nitrogen regulation response regulator GlnG
MSSEEPTTVVGARRPDDEDAGNRPSVPALTIIWHRDVRRIGDLGLLLHPEGSQISRKTPPFDAGADVVLSRAPFVSVLDRGGPVELRPIPSSVEIEVDGRPLENVRQLSEEQIRSGVILLLADELVVCLHRLMAPVQRGPSLGIVGGGDAIESVRRQIARVADLDSSVLIRGETGTGKELVALAIKDGSTRAAGPFVTVSMADVPSQTAAAELFGYEKGAFTGASQSHPGYFAQAHGGTLFLDEIALAAPDVQKMLLRVLETGEVRPLGSSRSRKVDVRLIVATDEKLEAAVREGRFSEPLLHRLSGYQIPLPPLRERREDIGSLFLHFLRKELAAVGELDRLATRDLAERPWLEAVAVARIAANPFAGNVRTLRNVSRQLVISNRGEKYAKIDAVIERILATDQSLDDAPVTSPSPSRSTKVSDQEIQEALQRRNYNFSAAAEALGIHRSTLYDRVRANPQGVRSASEISDGEILESHDRHKGEIAAMAAELHVSPKPLKARLTDALARRGG